METASEHLLRTFAAVPPDTRVLDAGCGKGRHTVPLAQLGFHVCACDTDADVLEATRQLLLREAQMAGDLTVQDAAALDYEDDTFGWVVACGLLDRYSDAERLALLAELRRVLMPGGWLYVLFGGSAETLLDLFERAGFAIAEAPQHDAREDAIRAIFRRVEAGTIA